jgi:aspartate aminotransferase-like enzyme
VAGLKRGIASPALCDETADFKTFRLGLFGLDKLHDVERTVAYLAEALDRVL